MGMGLDVTEWDGMGWGEVRVWMGMGVGWKGIGCDRMG